MRGEETSFCEVFRELVIGSSHMDLDHPERVGERKREQTKENNYRI